MKTMKVYDLDKSFSGVWHRDCELLGLKFKPSHLELIYYRDEDSTNWKISFSSFTAFKVTTEELGAVGYLGYLPDSGAFYELSESPWLAELVNTGVSFVKDARHFVFCFYDEIVEIIAPNFKVEKI
jgi:hypothetical protein